MNKQCFAFLLLMFAALVTITLTLVLRDAPVPSAESAGLQEVPADSKRRQDAQRPRLFYGQVVDQNGQGIHGCEIVVQMSQLVGGFNPVVPHSIGPDRRQENRGSVFSGNAGMFLVAIPQSMHILEIEDVKKPGYTWLKDFSLQTRDDSVDVGADNTQFHFEGDRAFRLPFYRADPASPAVFVMVRDAHSGAVSAMPSRGGFDLRKGEWVRNAPQPVWIPSTGPSAPVGDEALRQALEAYRDRRAREAATRNAR